MSQPAQQRPGRAPPRAVAFLGGVVILGATGAWNIISRWEGGGEVHLEVYADQLAGGLPTVCDGLTRHVTTTPIIVGQKWTLEQCGREESMALEKVQQSLLRCFKRVPPQSVFDSATSHAWNNGAPNTCASIAMKHWNAGSWRSGCERMARDSEGRPVWSYVRTGRMIPDGKGGMKPEMRFVQGLFNRRQDEANACVADIKNP
jgi:lysozyme